MPRHSAARAEPNTGYALRHDARMRGETARQSARMPEAPEDPSASTEEPTGLLLLCVCVSSLDMLLGRFAFSAADVLRVQATVLKRQRFARMAVEEARCGPSQRPLPCSLVNPIGALIERPLRYRRDPSPMRQSA